MKFFIITFIASISAVIGMLIVRGVFGEEWFARFYRVIAVCVVVAIVCVVGMVRGILRKSADADDDITDDLEAIIAQVYEEGHPQCTPSIQPQVDYIIWDRHPRRSGTEHHPTAVAARGASWTPTPDWAGRFRCAGVTGRLACLVQSGCQLSRMASGTFCWSSDL